MTPIAVKTALCSGLKKPSLVAALVTEGVPEPLAWTVVRAAALANLADELVGLAEVEVIEEDAAAEGRRILATYEMRTEAVELLSSITAALAGAAASPATAAG
jgi:hypothetical protein